MKLSSTHAQELKYAYSLLENPGLTMKIANRIGKPIEKVVEKAPAKVSEKVTKVSIKALSKIADGAIFTLKDIPGKKDSNREHTALVALSGAAGGFLGAAALLPELVLSTGIMMRSIADIARSQGESMLSLDTKLACLEVFALGSSTSSDDDVSESAYYLTRSALASSVQKASAFLAENKLMDKGAPVLIRLINKIAERFSIKVSEKMVAQSLPFIGAIGGAGLNVMFIDHFQDMATGHFTVRKLERIYGSDVIRKEYESLKPKIAA